MARSKTTNERPSPIQPAPSTVAAIATVALWRVDATQCRTNASGIVARKPAAIQSMPPRCAPSSASTAPAYAAGTRGRSERTSSEYSCSASTAATAARAKSHQPPRYTIPRTSGRPIAATSTREVRFDIGRLRSAAAEATPSARIVLQCGAQVVAAEVGPELVHEHELGIRELPQEKVRDPQLPGGADEQIGVRHLRLVQQRGEALLVEPVRSDARLDRAPRCLDDLGTTAVVERDPELQPVLVRGRGLELTHLVLQLERCAVSPSDEARAYT